MRRGGYNIFVCMNDMSVILFIWLWIYNYIMKCLKYMILIKILNGICFNKKKGIKNILKNYLMFFVWIFKKIIIRSGIL